MKHRLSWTALAFIPSSLMLGTTLYISTDIAAVPLLWVIPLAIYLATFVIAFSRTCSSPARRITGIFPGTALILTFVYLSGAAEPAWFLVPLHLFFLFMAALLCHGQLAESRPPAGCLAEYYFWIALGGMLGGLFNAILAPAVFSRVVEYPVAIVLACLVFRYFDGKTGPRLPSWSNAAFPAGVFLLTVLLALAFRNSGMAPVEKLTAILGVPIMAGYMFRRRRFFLGFSVAAVMLGSGFYPAAGQQELGVWRNFFGVLRVTADAEGSQHQLYHGDTIHGKQFLDAGRRCEPLAYYHRAGPLGEVFEAFDAKSASSHVAVVGLGTGAMAAYSKPGQDWTFYEINPAVLEIARDPRYFTYLRDCAHAPVRTVLGDARIRLQEAADGQYSLIVLDAFSSDSIPTHLITREAIRLYLSKLAPEGMLAFHISNRSLDLGRLLSGLADSEGLAGLIDNDRRRDPANGKDPSLWAVMARRESDLEDLASSPHWKPLNTVPRPVVWTDDFSNILQIFKW